MEFHFDFNRFIIEALKDNETHSNRQRLFLTDAWQDTWVYSEHPGKEFGKFVRTAGKFFNDETEDQGMSHSRSFTLEALAEHCISVIRVTSPQSSP